MSSLKYDGDVFEYYIIDDGTLDTCLEINGIEHRLSGETIRRHKDGTPYKADLEYWVKEIINSDERYWKD